MREHKINPTALAAKMGMLPTKWPPIVSVNVQIGHNGEQVVVKYSQKLDFITYTPDQAREHIGQLQACLDNLEQHIVQQKLNTLTVDQAPTAASEVKP